MLPLLPFAWGRRGFRITFLHRYLYSLFIFLNARVQNLNIHRYKNCGIFKYYLFPRRMTRKKELFARRRSARRDFFVACRNIIGFDTRGSARNCITHYPGFLARRNSIPATIIVGQENGAYPGPLLSPQTDTNETRTPVLRILGRRLPSIRLAVITEPRPTLLLLNVHVYASSVENVRHAAPSLHVQPQLGKCRGDIRV